MSAEEEELVRRVLDDHVREHDRAQWEGLNHMLAREDGGDIEDNHNDGFKLFILS